MGAIAFTELYGLEKETYRFTQSARVFEKKLGALRKAFKQRGIEPVFLDAPHEVPAATESSDATAAYDAEQSVDDPDSVPRSWWRAHENADGTMTYRHFHETMAYLRDFLDKEPPFDGCLGFSQGAAMAAVLTIVLRHPELHPAFRDSKIKPLKFGILVAGFPVIDPDLSKFWTIGLAETPSLHVIGRADGIVGPDRSTPLISAFDNPRVEYHDGGHFVVHVSFKTLTVTSGETQPYKTSWRDFLCDYILSFDNDPPSTRTVPSPPGSQLGHGKM